MYTFGRYGCMFRTFWCIFPSQLLAFLCCMFRTFWCIFPSQLLAFLCCIQGYFYSDPTRIDEVNNRKRGMLVLISKSFFIIINIIVILFIFFIFFIYFCLILRTFNNFLTCIYTFPDPLGTFFIICT